MNANFKLRCVATIILAIVPITASADTLATWNFNTKTAGSVLPSTDITADSGTGSVKFIDLDGYATPSGGISYINYGSPQFIVLAFGNDNNHNGDYFEFRVSTTGYELINLSFKVIEPNINGTGFDSDMVEYYNGSSYSSSGITGSTNPFDPNSSFTTFNYNFPTAVNNLSTAIFRITFNAANWSEQGYNKFDDIFISGTRPTTTTTTPVPEPWTFVSAGLMSLIGLAASLRNRRKSA